MYIVLSIPSDMKDVLPLQPRLLTVFPAKALEMAHEIMGEEKGETEHVFIVLCREEVKLPGLAQDGDMCFKADRNDRGEWDQYVYDDYREIFAMVTAAN
jgi:hypothetical protein